MSDEKLGIKETQEALVALGAIAVVARKAFRESGGDMAKFPAALAAQLMTNPEAMTAVKAGYEGANQIIPELKDLDGFEALALAECSIATIRKSFVEVQA